MAWEISKANCAYSRPLEDKKSVELCTYYSILVQGHTESSLRALLDELVVANDFQSIDST
ncbi:hypothetical protein CPB86DRAFT_790890 [Serendipita vermifera]|nr:hypothetical protein CPB86DRAFT_790890 [Serendipita vermifera]